MRLVAVGGGGGGDDDGGGDDALVGTVPSHVRVFVAVLFLRMFC